MIDDNVTRFCELISNINSINSKLKTEKQNFYDGGHTFEDCYKDDIDQLIQYQTELKTLISIIVSPNI